MASFGEKVTICCMGVSNAIAGVAEGLKIKLLSLVTRNADTSWTEESQREQLHMSNRCADLLSSEPVTPQGNARNGVSNFRLVAMEN
jgi:hypothetical protein